MFSTVDDIYEVVIHHMAVEALDAIQDGEAYARVDVLLEQLKNSRTYQTWFRVPGTHRARRGGLAKGQNKPAVNCTALEHFERMGINNALRLKPLELEAVWSEYRIIYAVHDGLRKIFILTVIKRETGYERDQATFARLESIIRQLNQL